MNKEMPPLFRCTRRDMRLTAAGCARLWRSANDGQAPEPYEGRAACRACPMGAVHAGVTGVQATPTAAHLEKLQHLCPRCRVPAQRLINGWLCISCYNRHREVLVGKNGKGARPLLTDVLHSEIFAMVDGDAIRVAQCDMVTGPAEAMILAAREIGRPAVFGWAPASG